MNEEKAIARIHDLIHTCDIGIEKHGEYDDLFLLDKQALETVLNLIETQKAEIEKRDKIINKMIEEYEYNVRINIKDFCDEEIRKDKCIQDCNACIKEYFTKLVEGEKKDG